MGDNSVKKPSLASWCYPTLARYDPSIAERKALEAASKPPAPPDTLRKKVTPRGPRVLRPQSVRDKERECCALLERLAIELQYRFDLGESYARLVSANTKGYVFHPLAGKDGKAKVGGAQKKGSVYFDRYLSYRLKNDSYEINAFCFKDNDDERVRWIVEGPKSLLPEAQILQAILPWIDEKKFGQTRYGMECSDFETAKQLYSALIAQVAPPKKN